MIRRPPRSTLDRSSAASDVYKRQFHCYRTGHPGLISSRRCVSQSHSSSWWARCAMAFAAVFSCIWFGKSISGSHRRSTKDTNPGFRNGTEICLHQQCARHCRAFDPMPQMQASRSIAAECHRTAITNALSHLPGALRRCWAHIRRRIAYARS